MEIKTTSRPLSAGSIIRLSAGFVLSALALGLSRFSAGLPEWLLGALRAFTLSFSDISSRVLSVFNFPFCEALIYLLVLSAAAGLVISAVYSIRYREARTFFSFLSSLVLAGGVLLFSYYLLFGMWTGFASPVMPEVKPAEPSIELLYLTMLDMQERANVLADRVPRLPDGSLNAGSFDSLAGRVAELYLKKAEPLGFSSVAKPKRVLWSRGLSWCGIAGVFMPYTAEANINGDMPVTAWAFTMGHELSHRYGTPREDECNYISYDLLVDAEDDLAYSAVFSAYSYLSSALYSADPERWIRLREGEGKNLSSDIRANSAYWKAFEGPPQRVAERVNDTHIKLDGVPEGVKSYDRFVELLMSRFAEMYG